MKSRQSFIFSAVTGLFFFSLLFSHGCNKAEEKVQTKPAPREESLRAEYVFAPYQERQSEESLEDTPMFYTHILFEMKVDLEILSQNHAGEPASLTVQFTDSIHGAAGYPPKPCAAPTFTIQVPKTLEPKPVTFAVDTAVFNPLTNKYGVICTATIGFDLEVNALSGGPVYCAGNAGPRNQLSRHYAPGTSVSVWF